MKKILTLVATATWLASSLVLAQEFNQTTNPNDVLQSIPQQDTNPGDIVIADASDTSSAPAPVAVAPEEKPAAVKNTTTIKHPEKKHHAKTKVKHSKKHHHSSKAAK